MAVLVTLILAAHFGYLAFLLLGGFLSWRWPRAIWAHLLAAVWAIAIVLGLVECPLTIAEGWARERAGEPRPTQGFVDRFLDGVIYPEKYVNLVRAGLAVIIIGSWVGGYFYRRARRSSRTGHGESPRKSEEESGRAATV